MALCVHWFPLKAFTFYIQRGHVFVFTLPWCKFEWWELQFSGQGTNQDSVAPGSVSSSAVGFLCNLTRRWSHPVPPFPNHRPHLFAYLFSVLFFTFVSWARVMPVLPQAGSALCTSPDISWGGHMLWNGTATAKKIVSDSSLSLGLCSSPYPTFSLPDFFADSCYCKSNLRLETRCLMTFVSFTKIPRKEKNTDIKYSPAVSSAHLLPSLSNTSTWELELPLVPGLPCSPDSGFCAVHSHFPED